MRTGVQIFQGELNQTALDEMGIINGACNTGGDKYGIRCQVEMVGYNLIALDAVDGKSVLVGTAQEAIGLPDDIGFTLDTLDGTHPSVTKLPVQWTCVTAGGYKPAVPGLYVFEGRVTQEDCEAAGIKYAPVKTLCYVGVNDTMVAPIITTTTLPGGAVGTIYSQTLVATGSAPISWALNTGSAPLPGGLMLSAQGVISGTPTAAGTFNFTVKATNGKDPAATQALSIVITAAATSPTATATATPTATSPPTPTGTLGATFFTTQTPTPNGTAATSTPTPTATAITPTTQGPVISATPTATAKPTATTAPPKPGDANCDGLVNIDDILLVRDVIFGLKSLTAQGRINLSITEDKQANIDTILMIRDIIFGS